MLARRFNAEVRGDEGTAFFAQRMDRLFIPHAFRAKPGMEFPPSAIAAIVVVGRFRPRIAALEDELAGATRLRKFRCQRFPLAGHRALP